MTIKFDKSDPDEVFRSEEHNEEVDRRMKNEEEAANKSGKLVHKGSKTGDRNRIINQVSLDQSSFNLINNLASQEGTRVQDYIGNIVKMFLSDPKNIKSPIFKLEALNIRLKRRVEYEETVRSAASEYAVSQSSEIATLLAEMCDDLGIDPEKAKTDAKDEPMVEAIANLKSDPGSKRNRCARWMLKYIKQHKFKVLAKVGNSAAADEGYGKDIVVHARTTLGVKSVVDPEDGKFYWVYPESIRAAKSILSGESE